MGKAADKHRQTKYGLTPQAYAQMLAAQGGKCAAGKGKSPYAPAICEEPETEAIGGSVRALSVDHDHKTGAVRALLCGSCNRGIGLLRDDPKIALAAASYLMAHGA